MSRDSGLNGRMGACGHRVLAGISAHGTLVQISEKAGRLAAQV